MWESTRLPIFSCTPSYLVMGRSKKCLRSPPLPPPPILPKRKSGLCNHPSFPDAQRLSSLSLLENGPFFTVDHALQSIRNLVLIKRQCMFQFQVKQRSKYVESLAFLVRYINHVLACVRVRPCVCVCVHITFLCFLALDNLQARNCTYIFRSIISINQPICWPLFADSESSYRNFYFQHLSKLWITSFVLFFFGFSCTRTSSVRPVHHGDLLFLASARTISVCT